MRDILYFLTITLFIFLFTPALVARQEIYETAFLNVAYQYNTLIDTILIVLIFFPCKFLLGLLGFLEQEDKDFKKTKKELSENILFCLASFFIAVILQSIPEYSVFLTNIITALTLFLIGIKVFVVIDTYSAFYSMYRFLKED